MTSFDFLFVAVLALSITFAVIRGAVREIGTLAALGAAAGAAVILIHPLQTLLGAGTSFMATVLIAGVIGLGAFILSYVLLHQALKRVTLSAQAVRIDRAVGAAFGLARGLVLVGLGFLAYGYYLDEGRRPDAVTKAFTLPVAEAMADFFDGLAPEGTRLTPGAKPEKAEPATNAAVEGYEREDRSALKEIVTTVTTRDDAPLPANDTDRQQTDDPIVDILKESDPE